jgi:hypothetical protein
VARLLSTHGISCAVINACDSASAVEGVDANLSRVFANEGIRNVLAMSYKFSTSAASLFHETFYESLFLHKLSFSDAASLARRTLKQKPRRRGQYIRDVKMQDWIIPVFYAHVDAKEVRIVPSTKPLLPLLDRLKPFHTALFLFFSWLAGLLALASSRKNRLPEISSPQNETQNKNLTLPLYTPAIEYLEIDQDVLRFEDELIANHILYFHGSALTGKTRLIRSLCHVWCITGFVERSYIIEAQRFLEDLPLAARLFRRFIHGDILYHTHVPLSKMPAVSTSASPYQQAWSLRSVIIIDQIDDLFHDMEDKRLARARRRMKEFLYRVAARSNVYAKPKTYLIIVGRADEEAWWAEHFSGEMVLDGPIFRREEPASFKLIQIGVDS